MIATTDTAMDGWKRIVAPALVVLLLMAGLSGSISFAEKVTDPATRWHLLDELHKRGDLPEGKLFKEWQDGAPKYGKGATTADHRQRQLLEEIIRRGIATPEEKEEAKRQGIALDHEDALGEIYRETLDDIRERGDAVAQRELGMKYYFGTRVPVDYAEAMKWFRLAADQSDHDAQLYLAYMYERGQGVSQDKVRAYMWFNLCAAQDDQYRFCTLSVPGGLRSGMEP